ncbi:MAG: hypothetical protein ACI4MY_03345 [Christensenellales bacterium]
MKRLDWAKSVLYPLILGVVALAIGVGLTIYYHAKGNANISSYLVPILTMAVGVVCLVGGVVRSRQYATQNKILRSGKTTTAHFIRYISGGKSGKAEYFSVEYTYADGETTYTKVSPAQFSWQEVLALKSAENFTIGYIGDKCLLLDDLQLLMLTYSNKMKSLQQKYEQAVDKVEQLQRDYEGKIATRNKSVAVQKQEERESEEQQKPTCDDGIN